jgi:hypothetical protein
MNFTFVLLIIIYAIASASIHKLSLRFIVKTKQIKRLIKPLTYLYYENITAYHLMREEDKLLIDFIFDTLIS